MKPTIRTRTQIIWPDDNTPFWLILLPEGYDDRNAFRIMDFLGMQLKHNVEIRRTGQPVYGARYTNLLLVDHLSDIERTYWWWDVHCRFRDLEVV